MHASNLVLLIGKLTNTEKRHFKKFVRSPYFNKHQDVVNLYTILTSLKEYTEKTASKEVIFQRLYPNRAYNDVRIRKIMSLLLKELEQFLVVESVKWNDFFSQIQLAETYLKKGLEKSFQQKIKQIKASHSKEKQGALAYYYNDFQLNVLEYQATAGKNRYADQNLQELSDSLDIYYMVNKLKQACNILTHSNLFQKTYTISFLPEILQRIEHQQLLSIPILALYYYSYKSLEQPDNENFFAELKKHIFRDIHVLKKEEQRDIYTLAINYCIKKLNTGNQMYVSKVFELYKKALSSKAILIKGKLSPFSYKNIASVGLRLKEFAWTKQFIFSYKEKIDSKDQLGYFTFNIAKLYFTEKKYDDVINLLSKTEIDDFFTNISAKTILMKSFYELGEYQYLESTADSFMRLIYRKKMMTYHQTNYINFSRAMKRILHTNFSDAEERRKTKEWIQNLDVLLEKEWFLEKISTA